MPFDQITTYCFLSYVVVTQSYVQETELWLFESFSFCKFKINSCFLAPSVSFILRVLDMTLQNNTSIPQKLLLKCLNV